MLGYIFAFLKLWLQLWGGDWLWNKGKEVWRSASGFKNEFVSEGGVCIYSVKERKARSLTVCCWLRITEGNNRKTLSPRRRRETPPGRDTCWIHERGWSRSLSYPGKKKKKKQIEMDALKHAAVIRLRIKRRRFHVRVGANLTLRKSKQNPFVASAAVNSIWGEGRRQQQTLRNEQTKHFLFCFIRIQLFNYSAEKVHQYAFMCVYVCIYAHVRLVHACVHMHTYECLCNYEYMGAAGDWSVGDRGLDDGGWWWESSLGFDWWGMGLTGWGSWWRHEQ